MLNDAQEETLTSLIISQRKKLFALSQELMPEVTADDLFNPHDHPKLFDDMQFNYEEGYLSGLLGAQAALRRKDDELQFNY
jgi:hypothetical protein